MKSIAQYGNVPISASVLNSQCSLGYELFDNGSLIRLNDDLYVVSPSVSGQLLSMGLIANHIYGPSYVSMESALSYYGLISERVYLTRSMTMNQSRVYDNQLGQYDYIQCDDDYFPIGIRQEQSTGVMFLMASPEKALCDIICFTPNLYLCSIADAMVYLEEDLRFDMESLRTFDVDILKACAAASVKKEDINNLVKVVLLNNKE